MGYCCGDGVVALVFGGDAAVAIAEEACGRVFGEETESAAGDWSGWLAFGYLKDDEMSLPFQCSSVGFVDVCCCAIVRLDDTQMTSRVVRE